MISEKTSEAASAQSIAFGDEEHELMAGLVLARFRFDEGQAVAAWRRLLQNDGRDEAEGLQEWRSMADRGLYRLLGQGLMPRSLPSGERGTLEVVLPDGKDRVETGRVQLGSDDWPGVFLRGDDALAYAMVVRGVLDEMPAAADIRSTMLEGLARTLESCKVGNLTPQAILTPTLPATESTAKAGSPR